MRLPGHYQYTLNAFAGKRSCLGELMARQEMFLFLAGLVQQFDVHPLEGQGRIEYTDKFSTTAYPMPFQVHLILRE